MSSAKTESFSQAARYARLAQGASDQTDVRGEFTIERGDTLWAKLYKFFREDQKKSTDESKKARAAMLRQMTRASHGAAGFDVDTIYAGDKFVFKGDTLEITRKGRDTIRLSLDLKKAHENTLRESRDALEGTRVDVANKWIDRGILYGVAAAGAKLEWKGGNRDRFIQALTSVRPGEFPTAAMAGMTPYSAEYNGAVIRFLRGLRDGGVDMGDFWDAMVAALEGDLSPEPLARGEGGPRPTLTAPAVTGRSTRVTSPAGEAPPAWEGYVPSRGGAPSGLVQGGEVQAGGLVQGGEVQAGGLVQGGEVQAGGLVQGGEVQTGGLVQGGEVQAGGLVQGGEVQAGGLVQGGEVAAGGAPETLVQGGEIQTGGPTERPLPQNQTEEVDYILGLLADEGYTGVDRAQVEQKLTDFDSHRDTSSDENYGLFLRTVKNSIATALIGAEMGSQREQEIADGWVYISKLWGRYIRDLHDTKYPGATALTDTELKEAARQLLEETPDHEEHWEREAFHNNVIVTIYDQIRHESLPEEKRDEEGGGFDEPQLTQDERAFEFEDEAPDGLKPWPFELSPEQLTSDRLEGLFNEIGEEIMTALRAEGIDTENLDLAVTFYKDPRGITGRAHMYLAHKEDASPQEFGFNFPDVGTFDPMEYNLSGVDRNLFAKYLILQKFKESDPAQNDLAFDYIREEVAKRLKKDEQGPDEEGPPPDGEEPDWNIDMRKDKERAKRETEIFENEVRGIIDDLGLTGISHIVPRYSTSNTVNVGLIVDEDSLHTSIDLRKRPSYAGLSYWVNDPTHESRVFRETLKEIVTYINLNRDHFDLPPLETEPEEIEYDPNLKPYPANFPPPNEINTERVRAHEDFVEAAFMSQLEAQGIDTEYLDLQFGSSGRVGEIMTRSPLFRLVYSQSVGEKRVSKILTTFREPKVNAREYDLEWIGAQGIPVIVHFLDYLLVHEFISLDPASGVHIESLRQKIEQMDAEAEEVRAAQADEAPDEGAPEADRDLSPEQIEFRDEVAGVFGDLQLDTDWSEVQVDRLHRKELSVHIIVEKEEGEIGVAWIKKTSGASPRFKVKDDHVKDAYLGWQTFDTLEEVVGYINGHRDHFAFPPLEGVTEQPPAETIHGEGPPEGDEAPTDAPPPAPQGPRELPKRPFSSAETQRVLKKIRRDVLGALNIDDDRVRVIIRTDITDGGNAMRARLHVARVGDNYPDDVLDLTILHEGAIESSVAIDKDAVLASEYSPNDERNDDIVTSIYKHFAYEALRDSDPVSRLDIPAIRSKHEAEVRREKEVATKKQEAARAASEAAAQRELTAARAAKLEEVSTGLGEVLSYHRLSMAIDSRSSKETTVFTFERDGTSIPNINLAFDVAQNRYRLIVNDDNEKTSQDISAIAEHLSAEGNPERLGLALPTVEASIELSSLPSPIRERVLTSRSRLVYEATDGKRYEILSLSSGSERGEFSIALRTPFSHPNNDIGLQIKILVDSANQEDLGMSVITNVESFEKRINYRMTGLSHELASAQGLMDNLSELREILGNRLLLSEDETSLHYDYPDFSSGQYGEIKIHNRDQLKVAVYDEAMAPVPRLGETSPIDLAGATTEQIDSEVKKVLSGRSGMAPGAPDEDATKGRPTDATPDNAPREGTEDAPSSPREQAFETLQKHFDSQFFTIKPAGDKEYVVVRKETQDVEARLVIQGDKFRLYGGMDETTFLYESGNIADVDHYFTNEYL